MNWCHMCRWMRSLWKTALQQKRSGRKGRHARCYSRDRGIVFATSAVDTKWYLYQNLLTSTMSSTARPGNRSTQKKRENKRLLKYRKTRRHCPIAKVMPMCLYYSLFLAVSSFFLKEFDIFSACSSHIHTVFSRSHAPAPSQPLANDVLRQQPATPFW